MALEREKNKLVLEKCQSILTSLLKDEDNKYCVDCDAKSPRWASWNIGIFLCIRCAGIHRNLGVHISKVKSVTLDTWTPQQVACIQQMGNSRARAVYEANLQDNFRRPQTDSSLEQFIRAKYEGKKYIAREWVPPPMPNPTWDLEVEKQLKKKREKKSVSGSVEYPVPVKNATPKSSGVSPKPLPKAPGGRNSSPNQLKRTPNTKKEVTSDKENTTSGTQDLLGLDVCPTTPSTTNGTVETDGDIFGDFLKAPTSTPEGKQEAKDSIQSEESSFFDQKSPEVSSEKLSKDSILALYNQTPHPQPHVQHQQLYGSGGGGAMFMGGGSMPMGSPQPGMGPVHMQQQNRMFAQQTPSGTGITQPYPSAGMPSMGLPMYPVGGGGIQLSAANPFAQVQAQMGNMCIGNMAPHSQPSQGNPLFKGNIVGAPNLVSNPSQQNTLATNLWQ